MARPFTVIGFTMFFTLALVFELGQKAAVVILSAAAAAFIFSLFFSSVILSTLGRDMILAWEIS